MNLLGHKEFTPALIAAFPELQEEVEDEVFRGLLHLEMACFARYTQAAIDARLHERLSECYKFADRFFREADDELKNAFYVSYLENLSFSGPGGERAKSLMPPMLLEGWNEIMRYLEELSRQASEVERKNRR
jgi:hypothetical protein